MDPVKDRVSKGGLERPGQLRACLRFAPIVALAVASIALLASGAHRYFTFEYLLSSRQWLTSAIAAHGVLALCAYVLAYMLAVALSLPGATLLTIVGGFLFGGLLGGVVALLAATCGATLLFLAAKGSLGALFRERAGPWLGRFRRGFGEDAASYMLFLRLTPVFPFWLVNLAPALLGVRLSTFVWTTLLGVAPATFAFAFAGAGLDSVAASQTRAFQACVATGATDCRAHIYLHQLVTRELLFSLAGLGVLALIPMLARRWRARDRT